MYVTKGVVRKVDREVGMGGLYVRVTKVKKIQVWGKVELLWNTSGSLSEYTMEEVLLERLSG